jgi:hypothetical protein
VAGGVPQLQLTPKANAEQARTSRKADGRIEAAGRYHAVGV